MAGAEDRLIAWLADFADAGDRFGDDAALLAPGERQYAISVDSQRAAVHFPPDLDPAQAARRLLAVSLSDLAASGARPRWALLALGVDDEETARRFLAAIVRNGREYGVELIGGDTARPSTSGLLDASLTVIGEIPDRGAALSRKAARPGDRLWTGGALGESAIGLDLVRRGARLNGRRVRIRDLVPDDLAGVARRALRRHLDPRPQIELGLELGRMAPAGAAIDVSDGLAADGARLARSSAVGCELDEPALALAPDAQRLAIHLGLDPLELALSGGEDYVLLFTLPKGVRPGHPGCRQIGRMGPVGCPADLRIRGADGTVEPLPDGGWDHLGPARGAGQVTGPQGGAVSG